MRRRCTPSSRHVGYLSPEMLWSMDGRTNKEVASEYGRTYQGICYWLERYGFRQTTNTSRISIEKGPCLSCLVIYYKESLNKDRLCPNCSDTSWLDMERERSIERVNAKPLHERPRRVYTQTHSMSPQEYLRYQKEKVSHAVHNTD